LSSCPWWATPLGTEKIRPPDSWGTFRARLDIFGTTYLKATIFILDKNIKCFKEQLGENIEERVPSSTRARWEKFQKKNVQSARKEEIGL